MKLELEGQTILLPSPILIIGTYGPDGQPNIMNAAWGGVASSNPLCVNVSIRPTRQTYQNIRTNKAFTVNIPSEKYVSEADYAGIVSGKKTNKFTDTGLTPVKSNKVNAPFVQEFPYALECKLFKEIDLGAHTMFIGEVVGMVADNEVLGAKKLPDIEKVRPMIYGGFGSSAYYGLGTKLDDAFSAGKKFQKE
jgi:flavin reductase (DIM6/NTAB) family NADH-FMN oxidoreductase RutF